MSDETLLFILLCLFWFCVFSRKPRVSPPAPPLRLSMERREMERFLDDRQRERDEVAQMEEYERKDRWFREDMARAHKRQEEESRIAQEASRRSMELAEQSMRMTLESLRRKGNRL